MIDPHIPEEKLVVTTRTLRQFAALSVLVLGGLAAWHGFVHHRGSAAAVLAGTGLALGAVGLARPEKIRPVFAGLMLLTAPLGHMMSFVLLSVLFYGVLAPLGLVLRLFGRDVLHVRHPDRDSHWTVKSTPTDVRDYTRQS